MGDMKMIWEDTQKCRKHNEIFNLFDNRRIRFHTFSTRFNTNSSEILLIRKSRRTRNELNTTAFYGDAE